MQSERASKEAGASTIPSCCCVAFTGDAEANDPDVQRGGCCLFILSDLKRAKNEVTSI